jgi:hypothetical protein
MVTMCAGDGMGAAAFFEWLDEFSRQALLKTLVK